MVRCLVRGALVKRGARPPDPPDLDFLALAYEACLVLTANANTRVVYMGDARRWVAFCQSTGINPFDTTALAVVGWVELLKRTEASKTRTRRLSALSSIYEWLRRSKPGVTARNPFDPRDGPKREKGRVEEPTPIADAVAVAAALARCVADKRPRRGARDVAIIRILWATGMRRSSLAGLTHERLVVDGDAFTCRLPAKADKTIQVWLGGRAAEALRAHLANEVLAAAERAGSAIAGRSARSRRERSGLLTGAVFRTSTGRAMRGREIWRVVGKRSGERLRPHSFRVAFLTFNPATLDERQDAAGHASPDTTRSYDREWRGKRAFVAMPEVETIAERAL